MHSSNLYYQSACRGPALLDGKQLQARKRTTCQFFRPSGVIPAAFTNHTWHGPGGGPFQGVRPKIACARPDEIAAAHSTSGRAVKTMILLPHFRVLALTPVVKRVGLMWIVPGLLIVAHALTRSVDSHRLQRPAG
jgi:hypothetical protein